MAIDKRGMFFTMIAIALLSLFLVSMSVVSITKDRSSISNRIDSMNEFVFSLGEDIPRKLYIAGFRIVFLHEKRMLETGEYFVDFNESFNEAFFNGTINGSMSTDDLALLEGVQFADIVRDVDENARGVNLGVNLTDAHISVEQDDPWNIKISFVAELDVRDNSGLASWNKTEAIEVYVPIRNFEDPLYLIGTSGDISHKINRTAFSVFDVANLTEHVENSYYLASNGAPSFIDRLEGNFGASSFGIESLVYLPDLDNPVSGRSVVDYLYFGSGVSGSSVSGMPSWFRLDAGHVGVYS